MNFMNVISTGFNITILILIVTYKVWSPKLFQYAYPKT